MSRVAMMMVSLVLVGCGGGGDGGVPVDPAQPPAADPTPNPQVTSELVASSQMDFASSSELEVSVTLAPARSAYVALYTGFTEQGGGYLPDYQRRLASGVTDAGRFQARMMAADEQQQLLIEVWFHGESSPLQRRFSLPAERIDWQM